MGIFIRYGLLGVLLPVLGGCASISGVSTERLLRHQALLDTTGLDSPQAIEHLALSWSPPRDWKIGSPSRSFLYTYQEWRSPTDRTGISFVHIRLPWPLNARTLVNLASTEYIRRKGDGRLLAQWSDELERNWFEAENARHRVRGFAFSRGFEAWLIGYGYRKDLPVDEAEMDLAARSVDTVLPRGLRTANADAQIRCEQTPPIARTESEASATQ